MTAALAIQAGGSLIAILALAGLARWLGLGRDVRIADAADAIARAEDAVPGFAGTEVAIDRAGIAALVRNGAGQVMLVRRHGAQFVGRLLDGHSHCRLDRDFLIVATGERLAAPVTLHLGEGARRWASSFRTMTA